MVEIWRIEEFAAVSKATMGHDYIVTGKDGVMSEDLANILVRGILSQDGYLPWSTKVEALAPLGQWVVFRVQVNI